MKRESAPDSLFLLFLSILLIFKSFLISFTKGMHKGTSEAPVLAESERERRSNASLWGEGKRKRFPLQPFAGE